MLQTALMMSPYSRMLRLDFQDLTAFERVTEQYRHLGVYFSGAIALEPSNPAFPPQSTPFVLMPLGHEMMITVSFDTLASRIGALVCGAGSIVLTAFDSEGKILKQASTTASPWFALNNQERDAWPQQQLELNGHGIAKVMFHSNSPFILNNLFFSQEF
jgi:hypothetical protein